MVLCICAACKTQVLPEELIPVLLFPSTLKDGRECFCTQWICSTCQETAQFRTLGFTLRERA